MLATLDELQAREWPAFTDEQIDQLMAVPDRPDWVTREIVTEYLGHYVNADCPGCDHGMFTWGLVHGAGSCARCGWPGRLYHFIGHPDDQPGSDRYYDRRFHFDGLLWAHPNEVTKS